MARTGRPPIPLAERFWPKVNKTEGCWEWQGAIQPNGYGKVRVHRGPQTNEQIGAHRASWELHHPEPIPVGMHICHTCDNRRCVNPAHLFLGTPSENQLDCASKGRHNSEASPKGSAHPRAKLTEAQVAQMRALKMAGCRNMDLAVRFGVSRPTVSQIVNGKGWRHAPGG